jgi:hypothetical protein
VGQLTARPKGGGAGRERDARAASDLQTMTAGVTPGSLRVLENDSEERFSRFEVVGLHSDAAETQRYSVRVD